MGAQAVLLICSLLSTEQIREYIGICDALGMSALVEANDEILEKEHRLPDAVIACVGGGSNAIGSFYHFIDDDQVRLIGCEAAGLDYPGIGPEHAYLHDIGRAEYVPVTDDEAVEAFEFLSRTEGIIPAIESAHAVAYAMKLAPTMTREQVIVITISGRGDKDCACSSGERRRSHRTGHSLFRSHSGGAGDSRGQYPCFGRGCNHRSDF